jgi:hypothetical protein
MQTYYQPDLQAHLTLDTQKRVRHILHTQDYFASDQRNARLAAGAYLQQMAETLAIPKVQLENLQQRTSFLDPRPQPIQYQLDDVKKFFNAATYCYYQTIHNVPVWHGGMTVTVKDNPLRITHSANYGHADLTVELPPDNVIKAARAMLFRINSAGREQQAARQESGATVRAAALPLRRIFAGARRVAAAAWLDQIRPTSGRFFIYRYDAAERVPKNTIDVMAKKPPQKLNPEVHHVELTLPLPPVPKQIRDGRHYLVAEIVFHLGGRGKRALNWRMLVEVQTGAVLWLRALTSGVNGLVFTYDPKTSTGDLTMTATQTNAVLNPLRDDVLLPNLDAPVAGVQSLSGTNVTVVDDDAPVVGAPTVAAGTDFNTYDARTDNFGAVNAYYHANNIFDVIEDLGFTLANYFDGTTFPVHVDHRASFGTADGVEINAFCDDDAQGDGIGLVGYCLSDDTNTTDPLGRSVDKWVHWHEIGGHGILYDHVESPNFGFAHSAGDSLAAFQNDPESLLRALPERFQYAPFRSWPVNADRWFNRDVAAGWGWDGTEDTGGYQSEQVLATTLFRMYQSLGGDSADVNKRWQASRVATYLVLNTVGKLTPGTNPADAMDMYDTMVDADADDWTSEGWAGGAYNKVIRWAFEKQGLFRAPGAPTTDIGAPPEVDLYIDDGRGGEYTYLAAHWNNGSVWNRQVADGGTDHQSAIEGQDNYAYVRVKNRGTTDASGTVTLFHCLPGAGLTWPTDFTQAEPLAGLATGNVLANSANEVIIGPFTWQPNHNVYGHDCLLAIVTAAGDPSNIDNLEPGQTIQEWRLVPHDNNVGQRNVTVVAGGGGGEALMADLNGVVFFAGNNFNKRARFTIKIHLPRVLVAKGWRVGVAGLSGNTFDLAAGAKRRIELDVTQGADFSADDIRGTADRNVRVFLYGDGMILGGMTYQLNPDIAKPTRTPPVGRDCTGPAGALLDCLHLPGQKVKKVCVKKVSLDIELKNDCERDCD